MKTNGANVNSKELKAILLTTLGVLICAVTGCLSLNDNEVIVYSALDKEFSQPILGDLAEELTLTIMPSFDVESNKTVGLVNRIINESNRPRCDVFWNNEILHTIRLQELGLLETYRSPQADRFPANFVSNQDQWHGFASRARVLIVNTDLLPDKSSWPTSVMDLANREWKSQCAIARPLFGTTATHAAVLFSKLGKEEGRAFFEKVAANAGVEGGNKQVALKVAAGQYVFGLTDTDDAIIEIENGKPVAIVFPDQQDSQDGALFIPNTLCIIKNGPNTIRAKRMVDRLLQQDIETRLAKGPSAQIPLAQDVDTKSRVEPKGTGDVKVMQVDFSAAAKAWDEAKEVMLELFPTGG